MGCSATTVRRRLRARSVPIRSRGPHRGELASTWTPERAYAVGLIATDGNLSRNGRHLTVTSADLDLLEVLRACLTVTARTTRLGPGSRCYRVQWSDRRLHRWLEGIGLWPAKSRTLGLLTADAHTGSCAMQRGNRQESCIGCTTHPRLPVHRERGPGQSPFLSRRRFTLEWDPGRAGVAKLANAPRSKCGVRKDLRVRVPPPAPPFPRALPRPRPRGERA